jgi:biopolymer transport protein ExbB/TolQ
MKKSLFILIPLLFVGLNLYSDENSDLKNKYSAIKKKREALESKYWEKKYSYLKIREKGKNDLEKINSDITHLLSQRSVLKEEVLFLERDISDAADRKSALIQRQQQFFSLCEKLYEKLNVIARNHVPLTRPEDEILLGKIKANIDKGEKITATARELIELIDIMRKRSRENILYKENIITQNNRTVAGYKLRLGTIFFGYLSDSSDEGFLARNGRVNKKIYSWFENTTETGIKKIISHLEGGERNVVSPLYMDVLQSPASGKILGEGASIFTGLKKWFLSGGIVMYVLLFVFIVVVAVLFERIFFYHVLVDYGEENDSKNIIKKILYRYITPRKPLKVLSAKMREGAHGSYSAASHIMDEVFLKEIMPLERNLNILKSLGSLAPLLGLLGTVTGMISLFEVITAFGTGDPRLLAGGISEALVTTEFGLIVAVPAMFFFRLLRNRADHYISLLEIRGLELLHLYSHGEDANDSGSH